MVQEAAEQRFPVDPHAWLPYKPATQIVDTSISCTGIKGLLYRLPIADSKKSAISGERKEAPWFF